MGGDEFRTCRGDGIWMSKCSKYCTDHPWFDDCMTCGETVKMTMATQEILGPYCEGCFGWPVCGCLVAHTGSCSAPKPLKEKR